MYDTLEKKRQQLGTIRNIGISAHVDAGKTTLTERVLFYTGSKHATGNVDDGNTTTDYTKQEKERGITIQSAAVSCSWSGYTINLIDTPGHVDFTIEVERSMRVLDGAVIVLCAKGGVQPQTRTVWRQADRHRIPRLVFVNKMDTAGANYERVVQQMRGELKIRPAVVQIPIGESAEFQGVIDLIDQRAIYWNSLDATGKSFVSQEVPSELSMTAKSARIALIETVAECDEQLLESYLAGEEVSSDCLRAALRKATLCLKLVPVLCGSAFQSKAVQPVLDAVCQYLPSPLDTTGTEDEQKPQHESLVEGVDPTALVALAFKVVDDPYGDLVFVRVYNGTLNAGSYAYNPRLKRQERVSRLVKLQGANQTQVDCLMSGEIGAVIGLKETITGDTLCTREWPVVLEPIQYPETVIALHIEPVDRADEVRLNVALQRMQKADPSFRFWTDSETGQTLIAGMGELHLQIKQEILADQGLETRCGQPQVNYRETISRSAQGDYTHRKQSGGPGQFARVILTIEPGVRGSGFEFVDAVTGGAIPRQFISSVERGVRESLTCGPVEGYPVVDVKVRLTGGQSHDTDSNDLAFRTAAAQAFKEAFAKAHPVLLEPLMRLEVELPAAYVGSAVGDIARRNGRVVASEVADDCAIIRAVVPLSKTFGYSTSLRSFTSGRGTFTLEFDRYEPVVHS